MQDEKVPFVNNKKSFSEQFKKILSLEQIQKKKHFQDNIRNIFLGQTQKKAPLYQNFNEISPNFRPSDCVGNMKKKHFKDTFRNNPIFFRTNSEKSSIISKFQRKKSEFQAKRLRGKRPRALPAVTLGIATDLGS